MWDNVHNMGAKSREAKVGERVGTVAKVANQGYLWYHV